MTTKEKVALSPLESQVVLLLRKLAGEQGTNISNLTNGEIIDRVREAVKSFPCCSNPTPKNDKTCYNCGAKECRE